MPFSASAGSAVIDEGRAVLGIELGSTRIKAMLTDPIGRPLATGSHLWENRFVNRRWTYSEADIWSGLQACYADLTADAEQRHGVRPTCFRAMGVSAMMHGYLAFDRDDELLVPFRTWRNTNTEKASEELTRLFGLNVPLRWSVAHLYQAIIDGETHVPQIASLNTLAGYVHRRLTGSNVLGVGDASGMFPIDSTSMTYDAHRMAQFDRLVEERCPDLRLGELLPEVLVAGRQAGRLTAEGAALLDPSGGLASGVPLCPPEGDAGTGMVASNAISPRTGNVSVGTSIFAMIVLEDEASSVHPEIDVVATPTGQPVAMVHCNNGASEFDAWAGMFSELVAAVTSEVDRDVIFGALLRSSLEGDADAGGLLTFNYLSGEPITGVAEGRPLVIRTPGSRLTLANFVRAQLYGAFATLSLGMQVLAADQVEIDVIVAHGGLFRTEGVAQRFLAAALNTDVAVRDSAGEGGAWGIAVLACFLDGATSQGLSEFLDEAVFAGDVVSVVSPLANDVEGFRKFLDRFSTALPVERTAVATT